MRLKEPKIVKLDQLILAGLNFFGDPFTTSVEWTEENEIGRTWKRFMAYLEKNEDRVKGLFKKEVAYEVHLWNEETAAKGKLFYIAFKLILIYISVCIKSISF